MRRMLANRWRLVRPAGMNFNNGPQALPLSAVEHHGKVQSTWYMTAKCARQNGSLVHSTNPAIWIVGSRWRPVGFDKDLCEGWWRPQAHHRLADKDAQQTFVAEEEDPRPYITTISGYTVSCVLQDEWSDLGAGHLLLKQVQLDTSSPSPMIWLVNNQGQTSR